MMDNTLNVTSMASDIITISLMFSFDEGFVLYRCWSCILYASEDCSLCSNVVLVASDWDSNT